ncbi:helix-turn-helix domain-containing protein [Haloarchaeobius litoreus]|uniref:Helix-turn-helix domain-containing protein n=1 Tax=Haloarchaeobius litoreus TaxID=755306 RepID=A0ABD6DDW2_9EURY|nr:helix-turn-helix domain-containing protein [Haloarchaeobius litoreus]
MDGLCHPTSLDRALESLAAEDRRRLLDELVERDGRSAVQLPDDLATAGEDEAAMHLRMRHIHLPKLAEAGFVDWDRERHTVRPGPCFDDVEPLLRLLRDHADELPE